MDEVSARRQQKMQQECADSAEGHFMVVVDWDEDISECEKCGAVIKG